MILIQSHRWFDYGDKLKCCPEDRLAFIALKSRDQESESMDLPLSRRRATPPG